MGFLLINGNSHAVATLARPISTLYKEQLRTALQAQVGLMIKASCAPGLVASSSSSG
jgi:hypothetical protein